MEKTAEHPLPLARCKTRHNEATWGYGTPLVQKGPLTQVRQVRQPAGAVLLALGVHHVRHTRGRLSLLACWVRGGRRVSAAASQQVSRLLG